MRSRTAFASIFWFCVVAPYFAIFTDVSLTRTSSVEPAAQQVAAAPS
jgi:hypothetical protein